MTAPATCSCGSPTRSRSSPAHLPVDLCDRAGPGRGVPAGQGRPRLHRAWDGTQDQHPARPGRSTCSPPNCTGASSTPV